MRCRGGPISFKLKDQQFPAFPHLLPPSFLPLLHFRRRNEKFSSFIPRLNGDKKYGYSTRTGRAISRFSRMRINKSEDAVAKTNISIRIVVDDRHSANNAGEKRGVKRDFMSNQWRDKSEGGTQASQRTPACKAVLFCCKLH